MKVAIVGAGVSGLVAARALHAAHEITLFEAAPRIGGHVHTWELPAGNRTWAVDSGFIVYNERNYPRFTRMLRELDVATQSSKMSFSVRHDGDDLEYNGSSVPQLFAQRRNALRPAFLRMLADVMRFNREAPRLLDTSLSGETLSGVLARGGYSTAFRDWYLLPMGSAIWSIPFAAVLEMPAAFFVSFFHNHGMLTVNDRPQWRVVQGGSQSYVRALTASFKDRIRAGHAVQQILRTNDCVEVDGERFDRVVIACHSNEALALLTDPTAEEYALLSTIPYQANTATIHTDTSILPKRRSAWGAWNYRIGATTHRAAVVTYNMNILQSLDAPETFCVTLNDESSIDPARILGRSIYMHPVFTTEGIAARQQRDRISGPNRTHYAGAYWGNGFHEDGVASGEIAAQEVMLAAHATAGVT